MGKIIEFGPGHSVQKVGPDWWPPSWFHKLMCKYVWKKKKIRGKWRLLECKPIMIICDVVDETDTHVVMNPCRLGWPAHKEPK